MEVNLVVSVSEMMWIGRRETLNVHLLHKHSPEIQMGDKNCHLLDTFFRSGVAFVIRNENISIYLKINL